MGIIWNKSSRQPSPTTHLTGWGKVAGITSYGDRLSLNNFETLFYFYQTNNTPSYYSAWPYQNAWKNVNLTHAVFSGNFGWGIGKQYSYQSNAFYLNEFRLNPAGFGGVPAPWLPPKADTLSLVNPNIIAAGNHFILAAYGNTLIGFGSNTYGQCYPPITSTTGLIQVSAGFGHGLALYSDGTLSAWGLNDYNQTNIPAGLTASMIASGYNHNIALKADKTVVCWGSNLENQCDVPAGLTGVSFIAAGFRHSLAIKEDGSVVCWGDNNQNQCTVPPEGLTGGYQISGGSAHTALLKIDGSVVCWGGTGYRQSILPSFPDPASDPSTSISQYKLGLYSPLGITGAATKVFCTENATFALSTGKRDSGHVMWSNPISSGQTGNVSSYATISLAGPTSASFPSGLCFYTKMEGYNPSRHDYYTYPYQPVYGESVWPNGLNTAWWLSLSTPGFTFLGKLDKCWVAGYQPNGIYKTYDSFSPPDLSGCSIRPRQYGAAWIGGSSLDERHPDYGYIRKNTEPYKWNVFNSGFWPNIIVTKKHTVCIGHFAGSNTNLYGVKWIRRDGTIITRDLTRISNLFFSNVGVNPDLYLYEMNTELTQNDLDNIAVYNVWPKFSGFTGSKTIDTYQWVWKGFTYIDYGSIEMMSQVGRRFWYLDAQDRVYSKRFGGLTLSSQINFKPYVTKQIDSKSSSLEPDEVSCIFYNGDSGTPVFITAGMQPGYTEPLEANYLKGQGITVGRTLFCGTFDYTIGQYGTTFVNEINNVLVSRGLAGNDLIKQIDVDSVGRPLPWTAPVVSGEAYPLSFSSPSYAGLSVSGTIIETENQYTLLGEATVTSWDTSTNQMSVSGISGSLNTEENKNYLITNSNNSSVLYSNIGQTLIIPTANNLGTVYGINDVLESEADDYLFNSNNGCTSGNCTEGP